MPGALTPVPLGFVLSVPIDSGTSCLCTTPSPVPVCITAIPPVLPLRVSRSMSMPGGAAPSLIDFGPEGLALLKGIEDLRLMPYDDQSGDDTTKWVKGATIGYGHLIAKTEWASYRDGITAAQADALFLKDLAPFESSVGTNVTVGLQQYQYDALVIFAFNIGVAQFRHSSAVALVNQGREGVFPAGLEASWKSWNKSQGEVMNGLNHRRHCEWRIFMMAIYERW